MDTERHEEFQILVRRLRESEGGGFIAEPIDLPFSSADGDTPGEAVAEAYQAVKLTLDGMERRGKSIPSPGDYSEAGFSGNFILRIPRSLHRRLTLRARAEGISLNQLCMHMLSEGLGRHEVESQMRGQAPETANPDAVLDSQTMPETWLSPGTPSQAPQCQTSPSSSSRR